MAESQAVMAGGGYPPTPTPDPVSSRETPPKSPDPTAEASIDEAQSFNMFDPHTGQMLDANFKGITDAGVNSFLALAAANTAGFMQMLSQSQQMFNASQQAAQADRATLARIVEANQQERQVLFTRLVTEAQDHHAANVQERQDHHSVSLDNARGATSNAIDHARTTSTGVQAVTQRTAQDGQTLTDAYLQPTETSENISDSVGATAAQAVTKGMQDIVPSVNNAVKAAVAEAAQNTVGATGQVAYGTGATVARDQAISSDVHAIATANATANAAMNQANALAADMAEIKSMITALATAKAVG